MMITIASGKGGTGKTTVSLNLARQIASEVQLLDCDVEEPNSHLFLKRTMLQEQLVTIPVPEVDESRCVGCGACGKFCEYNAIVSLGAKPLVFVEMCHGCGGCMRVCQQQAICEINRRIGVVATSQADQIRLVQGRMDVGITMAPPLIRAVKSNIVDHLPIIVDAPPGTSCPAVAALRGADFVLLVTEPTPFGFHDLKLAVAMVREMHLPCGVVINRAGTGYHQVYDFCNDEKIPILLEIPDDRRIAEAYSRGELIVDALPEYRQLFQELIEKINPDVVGCCGVSSLSGADLVE